MANSQYKYFCSGPKEGETDLYDDFRNSPLYDDFAQVLNRVAYHTSSLLADMDNNPAENFNSLVNKLIGGKRVNYSLRGSYEARCFAAATTFNRKGTFLDLVQARINGGKIGYVTKQYCLKKLNKPKKNKKQMHATSKIYSADSDYGATENNSSDMNCEELKTLIQGIMETISNSDISEVEKITRGQSKNSLWFKEKQIRLTASNFGKVCKLRLKTSTANLVKFILYTAGLQCAAVKYGIMHKNEAINQFQVQTKLSVQPCGLFIHPHYPYLAASPDGLVGADGIIEVKCPYAARDMSIKEAIKSKHIKYLIENQHGGISLKRNHIYYFQVQSQLEISNREFYYFVVYTKADILYEKILKDNSFWNSHMKSRLKNLYFGALLPEIVDSRVARNTPIRTTNSEDLENNTFMEIWENSKR